ncbi:MAG: FG-GAP-like repeat-containing protein, partial [Tannerella sp.]|nr:FG-GAP-like repeat-containing protein [Tannerella sp.]
NITGGTVTANGGSYIAINCATIAISNGNLTATSYGNSAIFATTLVDISGGNVTATVTSGDGVAICNNGQTVTISGGVVTARNTGTGGGAAIGGSNGSAGGTITISGGTVTASSTNGAAIGGGRNAAAGTIKITGGTVRADGRGYGADIGGGSGSNSGTGTVIITGGSVYKYAPSSGPLPTNGEGVSVYYNALTVGDPSVPNTPITEGIIDGIPCNIIPNPVAGVYGIKDVVTDGTGKVYFWLPSPGAPGQVVLGTPSGSLYSRSYTRTTDNTNAETLTEYFFARPDTVTTTAGIPVRITPLANDHLPTICTPSLTVIREPEHGTITPTAGPAIIYTPNPGWQGRDSIHYRFDCTYDSDNAWIYIYCFPDNVISTDCAVPITEMIWSIDIDPIKLGNNDVSVYQTPYVGDLDGDGHVEIVVAKAFTGGSTAPWSYYTNGIHVFDRGNNTSTLFSTPIFSTNGRGQIGLARPNASSPGIIVVAAMNGFLYAYDKAGNPKWETINPYTTYNVLDDGSVGGYKSANIMFSDFNGDGNAEIVTGDRIFDLATGTLLLDCGFLAGRSLNSPKVSVIDVDGDGRPELVWGGDIYSIDIATPQTGNAGNSFSLRQITPPSSLPNPTVTATIPADFDLDGQVDILAYGDTTFYVYDPVTSQIKVSQVITPADRGAGTPFVGDIDGDRYPEIMYGESPDQGGGVYNIIAWDIDGAASGVVKWRKGTTDGSRGTGLTLFDFDQNGTFEILYRDQTQLRIFNGTSQETMNDDANTPSIPCYSGTLGEYPVTADVDGDGEAEIVVTGAPSNPGATSGYVYIFNPGPGARWAPAREVWNQYAYNVVNINKDLTVPTAMFDIAMIMAGPDSTLNTGDDVQPFNGFLKQSTVFDRYGNMVMYAPDVQPSGSPAFVYDAGGDSLRITFAVTNTGSSAFQPTLCVTAYRDAILPANAITTDSVAATIYPDDMETFTLVNRDFSTLPPFDEILIAHNDRGQAVPVTVECKYGNDDIVTPFSTLLLAHNDRVPTAAGMEVLIPVLRNDSLPPGCTPTPEIVVPFMYSAAVSLSGDTVRYTPQSGFTGLDSLTYRLACSGDTAFARVYVYVSESPDNVSNAKCFSDPSETKWDIELFKEFGTVFTVQSPLVGDLDGDGYPDVFLKSVNGTAEIRDFTILRGPGFDAPVTHPTPVLTASAEAIGRIRWDASKDTTVIVVVEAATHRLLAYDIDGNQLWPSGSSEPLFHPSYGGQAVGMGVGFADFNNDGYAEVYAGNQIFDAVTGVELCSGGATGNIGLTLYSNAAYGIFSMAADVTGDARLELCAGNRVYEVSINDRTDPSANSMTVARQVTPVYQGTPVHNDGATVIADFDLDGEPEILVQTQAHAQSTDNYGYLYIWKPSTEQVSVLHQLPDATSRNVPFVGDINGDGKVEIVVLTGRQNTSEYLMRAFAVDGGTLNQLWQLKHTDSSGSTGLTLFDFNQDGISEIVYRDEDSLRIINGSLISHITRADTTVYDLWNTPVASGTMYEYPTVADVNGDGHAEILATGSINPSEKYTDQRGRLLIYKGTDENPWAPARRVWNQYMYNAANVNEDLTIPRYPLSPATVFPGRDSLPGTADDLRPYNNFMQQQTTVNELGVPVWLMPDAAFEVAQTSVTREGDSIAVRICIVNLGDAALGDPFFVTLYSNVVHPDSIINTDSIRGYLHPGDPMACLTFGIPNVRLMPPFVRLIVRLNDRGYDHPHQPECDYTESIQIRINPALDLLMRKEASVDGAPHNGFYANPVSVLYTDTITYEITAVNASIDPGVVVIRDTLPAYLRYAPDTATGDGTPVYTPVTDVVPPLDALEFTTDIVAPFDTVRVRFEATPEEGVSASQPFFVNTASVVVSDTLVVPTNSTYHQGAGVAVVTFSSTAAGSIYNAGRQALDYRTSPRSGILVVPDSGYVFAGWSHDAYHSLKGALIPAAAGIMRYDTLTVYGNVTLLATFIPDTTSVDTLAPIPGALEDTSEKVWSSEETLYVRTTKGALVRVYTPDGILCHQFVTPANGITTRRLARGIYIVTLNGRIGWKIVVNG